MGRFSGFERRIGQIAALGMVLCVAWTAPAWTQCVYTELESDVPHLFSPPTGTDNFQFEQNKANWMAIAVRPTVGFTPQILIYQSAAPHPNCATGLLESDEQSTGVSVVVGNFHREPTGTYYGKLDEVLAPSEVPVEWDDGNGWLRVNDPWRVRTMAVDDVVDIWSMSLEAGTEYGFQLREISGDGLSLLLFDDADPGADWASRSTAVVDEEVTNPIFRYTPVSTGTFGVVVVKDSAEAVTYEIAVGACVTPTPIGSSISVQPGGFENYYEIDQQWLGWTAVGARAEGAFENLSVYAPSADREFPTCFTDRLVGSVSSYNPVVVRYFDPSSGYIPGVHYLRVGPDADAVNPLLEWDGQGGALIVNDPPGSGELRTTDVLDVWGVDLVAGQDYTFHFDLVGSMYPYILLYPPNDTAWMNELSVEHSWDGTFDYTATETGNHGIVVLNQNGEYGRYKLAVSTCGQPQTLSFGSHTSPTPPGETHGRFRFYQEDERWAGLAVDSDADWNIDLYEHPTGSAAPLCLSGLLATSDESGTPPPVDFIVGDFRNNPLGEYYVHAEYAAGSLTEADVQWDGGRGSLHPSNTETGSLDDFHMFDVRGAYMLAGHEYQIQFEKTSGSGSVKLFVFEPLGGALWASRGEHVLETTSSTTYTPATSGLFGLVIVNDTELAANYEIRVFSPTVSAEPGLTKAGIHSLIPNPTTGSITIHFGVSSSQPVAFEIIDVAGRVIARLPAGEIGAGTRTQSWNGLSSNGTRPPAGVYFARMIAGREVTGIRKFVMLE